MDPKMSLLRDVSPQESPELSSAAFQVRQDIADKGQEMHGDCGGGGLGIYHGDQGRLGAHGHGEELAIPPYEVNLIHRPHLKIGLGALQLPQDIPAKSGEGLV